MKPKNIRYINCACCTRYCQNKNKNKFIKILANLKKDGVKEVIFCCEALNGSMKEISQAVDTKIGYQDKSGNINYF